MKMKSPNWKVSKMSWLLICVLCLCQLTLRASEKIMVAETSIKVNAMGKEELYYGFAAGDEVIFNFELIKGKDLKEVEIIEYPNSSVFIDFKVKSIESKIFKVKKEGIYIFRFKNSSVGQRIGRVKIERIPESERTFEFDPSVFWKTRIDTTFYTENERYLVERKYETKNILPTSKYYINSGSNATFKGGKSRIAIPVSLPRNTVEWCYQFSASRSKEQIEKTKASFHLLADLTKIIDETGLLGSGINSLTSPPGADICDVYLLDLDNSRLFLAKNEYQYYLTGSRESIKSGLIKMSEQATSGDYLIGIKNPDSMHGVHVVIEVVAVVLLETWGNREIEKYKTKSQEVPFLH